MTLHSFPGLMNVSDLRLKSPLKDMTLHSSPGLMNVSDLRLKSPPEHLLKHKGGNEILHLCSKLTQIIPLCSYVSA
jgi:hypothetical protein